MPPSRKPAGKAASSAKPAPPVPRPAPNPRLNGAMACDTAFRIVARRHLDALNANQAATCNGDSDALHQMRVALTHLRTAILFFSPMVHDAVRDEVRDELKWLNSELGAVRDLDVAVDRVKSLDKKRPQAAAALGSWNEKRSRRPSHPDAHAQFGQISLADRSDLRLDRKRPMVDEEGQAGRQGTRLPDRRL